MSYLENDINSLDFAVYVDDLDELTTKVLRSPTIDDLNNQIGFEKIKKEPYGYRTVVNSNRGYVLIYFDANQVCTGYKLIRFSSQKYQNNVKSIEGGISLTDVRRLDPDGDYTFLLSSWSQYPQISYHFFEDGTAFEIHYSNDLKVAEIYTYTI